MAKKNKVRSADPYDEYDEYSEDVYGGDSSDPYGDDDTYNGGTETGYIDSGDDPYDNPTPRKPRKSGNPLGAIIGVIAAVVILAGVVFGVSMLLGPTNKQCKETLQTAQEAINELDVKAACRVIEPSVGRKLLAVITVLDSLMDSDAATYLSGALEQLGADFVPDNTEEVTDLFKGLEIEPYSFGLPGKTRNVKARILYDGVTYAKVTFTMRKSDGEVYIAKVSMIKE